MFTISPCHTRHHQQNPTDESGTRPAATVSPRLEDTDTAPSRAQADGSRSSTLRFLAMTAHELKTPLTSVIGALEVLRKMDGQLDHKRQNMLLTTALQEAHRLDQMIATIMDLARVESGGHTVRTQISDLAQVMADTLLSEGGIRTANVELRHNAAPAIVMTDEALLKRALSSLLACALKSTQNDTDVILSYRQEEDKIHIDFKVPQSSIMEDKVQAGLAAMDEDRHVQEPLRTMWLELKLTHALSRLLGGALHCQNLGRRGIAYTMTLNAGL